MVTYTQEQLEIEILKTKSDTMQQTMERVERRLDTIDTNIKTQFHNFTNYMLGIYGLILASALAHLTGIF